MRLESEEIKENPRMIGWLSEDGQDSDDWRDIRPAFVCLSANRSYVVGYIWQISRFSLRRS